MVSPSNKRALYKVPREQQAIRTIKTLPRKKINNEKINDAKQYFIIENKLVKRGGSQMVKSIEESDLARHPNKKNVSKTVQFFVTSPKEMGRRRSYDSIGPDLAEKPLKGQRKKQISLSPAASQQKNTKATNQENQRRKSVPSTPFLCGLCQPPRYFTKVGNLKRHVQAKHGDVLDKGRESQKAETLLGKRPKETEPALEMNKEFLPDKDIIVKKAGLFSQSPTRPNNENVRLDFWKGKQSFQSFEEGHIVEYSEIVTFYCKFCDFGTHDDTEMIRHHQSTHDVFANLHNLVN